MKSLCSQKCLDLVHRLISGRSSSFIISSGLSTDPPGSSLLMRETNQSRSLAAAVLIRSGKNDGVLGRLPAYQTGMLLFRRLERNVPAGCPGLFLHLALAGFRTAPSCQCK